jgi:hypothetical protein
MVDYQASFSAPPARGIYVVTLMDVPGALLSNNFLSVMNPKGSGIRHETIDARLGSYSIGASMTGTSMGAYRITSHSGGSLYDKTTVERADTGMLDPISEVRSGNPTVVRLNNTPVLFKAPVLSTGAGNTTAADVSTPPGLSVLAHEGEGFVANTAAGNTNQMWNLTYIWAEYQL